MAKKLTDQEIMCNRIIPKVMYKEAGEKNIDISDAFFNGVLGDIQVMEVKFDGEPTKFLKMDYKAIAGVSYSVNVETKTLDLPEQVNPEDLHVYVITYKRLSNKAIAIENQNKNFPFYGTAKVDCRLLLDIGTDGVSIKEIKSIYSLEFVSE